MKRLSTFLLALMLMSIGANAQVDYTSYLDKGTWTRDAGDNGVAGMYQGGQERYGDAITGSTGSPTKVIYETVEGLPAGTYTLQFYAVANNAWVGSATGDNIAQVYVTANETTQTEAVTVYDQTSFASLAAYPHTFTVTVGQGGTLEYGLRNVGNGGNWYVCQGWNLTRTDETTPTPSTSAELDGCVADLSHWATTGNNGEFRVDTWATESDVSQMVTPLLENWITSGSTLTSATISHRPLTGLAKGYYEVSMDIRIFSEAGNTIGSGTTFNANSASEDLVTGSDGISGTYGAETEVYGTYKLTAVVGDDGELDISIDIPSTGVTYNWIAWKNLSVKYTGPIEDATIGSATASKTVVQPGEEVTITFDVVAPSADYTLVGSEFTDRNSGITVSYDGNGAFTFTVPDDASGTFTVTIPAGQLYYTYNDSAVSNSDGSNAEQTLTFTVAALTQTEGVYLKNLYGGDLLSRGKDYGTRADVDFVGLPLNLILQNDGRYVIQYADVDPSEATDNYLYGTSWAWADGKFANSDRTPTPFTVEEYTDEEGNIGYHFISDYGLLYRYDADDAYNASDYEDDYALAVNGIQKPTSEYNFTYDTQAMWTIVSIEERDAIKAQWVSDQKVAVAAEAGITVTSGDDFDKYVASLTETLVVSDAMEDNSDERWGTSTFYTNGVEAYQTVVRLNRTITSLDKGIYKVTLNGFERHADNVYCYQMYQDGYTDISNSYLVAGDYEINLKAWGTAATGSGSANSGYNPNDMEDANTLFKSGEYLNELYTYVGDDGTLSINISLLTYDTWGWAQVKNFSLYKLDQTETEISWEMTEAGYGTLILPFEASVPEELVAYTIGSVTADSDDEDIAATLSLSDAGSTIKENTPYIMGGTAGTYKFTGTPTNTANSYTITPVSGVSLTGTFVDMDYDDLFALESGGSTVYLLQNHDDVVAFYPVVESASSAATLTPYHCYLTLTEDDLKTTSGAPARLSFSFGGEATGIVAVESEEAEANGAIYDLSGRKVSKAVKGVYIQNGKKVLVK